MESFPKSISQWVQWVHETHQWLWGPGVHPWDDYTWKVEMPSDFFLDLLSKKHYGRNGQLEASEITCLYFQPW